ncbi:MAG: branched-chain amino acid ABC transporter permease [Oscillospiraceae bacterium]
MGFVIPDLPIFMQQLINSISVGCLYALIAVGYTMVYGILRLINFAHGDIVMMAAYFIYFGIAVFNLPWQISFIVAVIMTAILGVLIEKVAYRPLRDAPKTSVLISAIGVSYLLENLATYLFSGKPKSFPPIGTAADTIQIKGIFIQKASLITPLVVIVLVGILLFVINKTKLGMAMRAVSKDYEIARVMGIKIDKVISYTFIIGTVMAAVGALLWGIKYPKVEPMMGVMPGLKCFIAAVIGGIGNIKGATLGGFILGVGEGLIITFLPELSGYRDAFAFIFLIIILLVRPNGLLGEKVTEKV